MIDIKKIPDCEKRNSVVVKILMHFFIFSVSLFGSDAGQQAMSDESWKKIHRVNDSIDFIENYGFYILAVLVICFCFAVTLKNIKNKRL